MDPRRVYVLAQKENPSWWEKYYFVEVLRGLGITIRHFLRNLFRMRQIPSLNYPEFRKEVNERYRGMHRLTRRPDGSPKCVACMCCATACPALCIHIEATESPNPDVEKVPSRFDIDILRCVFCGLCVEACPEDAIRMDTGVYALSGDAREKFLLNKEFLLSQEPDKPEYAPVHDVRRADLAGPRSSRVVLPGIGDPEGNVPRSEFFKEAMRRDPARTPDAQGSEGGSSR
jgi:NADH-quinone oxidoreductase subunit I